MGLIRAEAAATRANKALDDERIARSVAQQAQEEIKKEAERYRRLHYEAEMNLAMQAWEAANIQRGRASTETPHAPSQRVSE